MKHPFNKPRRRIVNAGNKRSFVSKTYLQLSIGQIWSAELPRNTYCLRKEKEWLSSWTQEPSRALAWKKLKSTSLMVQLRKQISACMLKYKINVMGTLTRSQKCYQVVEILSCGKMVLIVALPQTQKILRKKYWPVHSWLPTVKVVLKLGSWQRAQAKFPKVKAKSNVYIALSRQHT